MNIDFKKLKDQLSAANDVDAAYLFGSAAKQEPVVNDLDILVLPSLNADFHDLYFSLVQMITEDQKIEERQLDILFFDLKNADPFVLYDAVDTGILLCNKNSEHLGNSIEELSLYFLQNEPIIKEAARLRREKIEAFCGNRY